MFITNINKLLEWPCSPIYNEKQKPCLFLKDYVFNCLTDELLSSFDHLKSLSTSKGKQQSPSETKSRSLRKDSSATTNY